MLVIPVHATLVAVAALPVHEPELPLTFPVTSPVKLPLNVLATVPVMVIVPEPFMLIFCAVDPLYGTSCIPVAPFNPFTPNVPATFISPMATSSPMLLYVLLAVLIAPVNVPPDFFK